MASTRLANMSEKAPHSRFNPNESYLEGRGSWLTYVLLICLAHFAILSVPFFDTATAWTLTSILHCLATYYFLHYLKGNPFENSVDGGTQGKDRRLTHWEQINQGEQNTTTRKFMTLVPIVIFMLASYYTKYELCHFIINTGALASTLVPKLPQLHKKFPLWLQDRRNQLSIGATNAVEAEGREIPGGPGACSPGKF